MTFESVRSKLKCFLIGEGLWDGVLEACDPKRADGEIASHVHDLLETRRLFPRFAGNDVKSAGASERFRLEGNKAFLNRNDLKAIRDYTSAVGHAPTGSEQLALALGNRSAATFAMGEYRHCLKDTELALSMGYPDSLKYKLLDRKGRSLLQLGSCTEAAEALKSALEYLPKAGFSSEKEAKIKDQINRTLFTCGENNIISEKVANNDCKLPTYKVESSKTIESASCLIDINYSSEMGRHIVATRDIEPGDVLAIERPYVSVLLPNSYTTHCFNCKTRCHSLIPCKTCTRVFFCSSDCLTSCSHTSHKVECSLLPALLAMGCNKMELLAVRVLVEVLKQGAQFDKFISNFEEIDKADDVMKGYKDGVYSSGDYASTHHLEGNKLKRKPYDLFSRAIIASCIVEAIDRCTDFFKKCEIDSDKTRLAKAIAGGLTLRYLQSMPCNAHEISEMCITHRTTKTDIESNEIGGAVYPLLSLINHSCDPNVVRHSYCGDAVVLTAIQVIKAGDQIFDNYGYHHAVHSIDERRCHLGSQYYFSCQCIACTNDWPLYNDLPDKVPTYFSGADVSRVEKSSERFVKLLKDILNGDTENKLPLLYEHLSLLHNNINRPWKQYSECQEAIKQCLSLKANHYIIHKT
ncbi:hypothetical protein AAG570_011204 [Ranatra chinensis]|uniref:SET domain-containing protein n=1 Tax=Ranatra chinensis TaxID=642074 RepID=A0ABD0YK75_9HEMI